MAPNIGEPPRTRRPITRSLAAYDCRGLTRHLCLTSSPPSRSRQAEPERKGIPAARRPRPAAAAKRPIHSRTTPTVAVWEWQSVPPAKRTRARMLQAALCARRYGYRVHKFARRMRCVEWIRCKRRCSRRSSWKASSPPIIHCEQSVAGQ